MEKQRCFTYGLAIDPTTLSNTFKFWFWLDTFHLSVACSNEQIKQKYDFFCHDIRALTALSDQVKLLLLFFRFCI